MPPLFLPENERHDPYRRRKQRLTPCYRVHNKNTRNVFSKCTTQSKALRQLGYLQQYRNAKFQNALPRARTRRTRRITRNNNA